jgi:ABC-type multidrug transport system fused ATPase/permease subunit
MSKKLWRSLIAICGRSATGSVAWLAVAMAISAVFEVIGVGSILPFTAVLAQPEIASQNRYLNWLKTFSGLEGQDFVLALGLLAVTTIVLANATSISMTWMLTRFTWRQGHNLGERLLASYMAMPYVEFLRRNTADMLENLFTETVRVVTGVLIPALMLLSRSLAMLCIAGLLFVLDPVVAALTFVLIGGAFLILFVLIRRSVARNSAESAQQRKLAFRAATEALNGIRDVKLHGLEGFMLERFSAPSRASARFEAANQVINSTPRYFLEIVAFAGLILVVLFLVRFGQIGSLFAPLLATYAVAAYRLMPALQQVYGSLTQLQYHQASLDMLLREIKDHPKSAIPAPAPAPAFDTCDIRLTAVRFAYDADARPVLEDIDLHIPPRTSVAITGRTGSGKTTLVDIIMGLLEASSGRVTVDRIPLDRNSAPYWQARVGYVPHNFYLLDDTIAANIAFGVAPSEMNRAEIERAAKIANLHDFVSGLEKGYDAIVGERGGRLSSGQRQRIGIARALYRRPSVLVLDEATSALDYETEAAIVEALNKLKHQITIIMIAHRLHTIEQCDAVYEIVDGKLHQTRLESSAV